MKKIIFLVSLFILISPSLVKADSVRVTLSCPSSANLNSKIECKINVTSDVLVNGLSGNYSFTGLSYVGFTPQNGFTTYSSSANGFAVGNNSGKRGTFTIGIVTFKVKENAFLTIKNLDASDVDFNSYTIVSKSTDIRIKSTNNNLASLSISNGTLSPSFSANTINYTATVNSSSIVINATKGDSNQTIKGAGTKQLNYGKNTFQVVVTSESGSSKTYTIVITRPDNRSSNNYLKSLSLDKGNISFNKNTNNYSVSVDSNVTSIKINASLEDGKASFVSGYGSRNVNLNYGKNVILVKVKAENDSVRTYTITVNRKDNRSPNNYLKSITLSEGIINFDKDTLEYNITVKNEITDIKIDAVSEDKKAKVEIENSKLKVGNNVIKINVISENKKTRTYILNVKRLSEEEKMSDNNNILNINIFGHDLEFSNNENKYNVNIGKDEKELLFDIKLEDENASYKVEGNKDLENGSIVNVVVISESGIENKFEFLISKEKDNSLLIIVLSNLTSLMIGIGIGVVSPKLITKLKK